MTHSHHHAEKYKLYTRANSRAQTYFPAARGHRTSSCSPRLLRACPRQIYYKRTYIRTYACTDKTRVSYIFRLRPRDTHRHHICFFVAASAPRDKKGAAAAARGWLIAPKFARRKRAEFSGMMMQELRRICVDRGSGKMIVTRVWYCAGLAWEVSLVECFIIVV